MQFLSDVSRTVSNEKDLMSAYEPAAQARAGPLPCLRRGLIVVDSLPLLNRRRQYLADPLPALLQMSARRIIECHVLVIDDQCNPFVDIAQMQARQTARIRRSGPRTQRDARQ